MSLKRIRKLKEEFKAILEPIKELSEEEKNFVAFWLADRRVMEERMAEHEERCAKTQEKIWRNYVEFEERCARITRELNERARAYEESIRAAYYV